MSPVTRVGKSSSQIPIVRVNVNALLPGTNAILPDDNWEPLPLRPEPPAINWAAVRELEVFATSEEARDARTAMRFVRQMGGGR